MKNTIFKVKGKILDKNNLTPLSHARVEAWDKDLLIDDFLGSAVTDSRGKFEIEFDTSKFGEVFADKVPDVFFRVYCEEKKITDTLDYELFVNLEEKGEVQILVDLEEAEEKQNAYRVFGKVRLYDGTPVNRMVKVFPVSIQGEGEEPLVKGKSDEEGNYSLSFIAALEPDIKVKAYQDEKSLAESETHYGISKETEINLRGMEQFRGPSEFEKQHKTISKFLEDVSPSGIEEEQINYLSGKTGLDKNTIDLLVKSEQFKSSEIPSDFYYTLFKAGARPDEKELYRVNVNEALEVFKKAKEQGEIVPQDNVDLESVKKSFVDKSVQHILKTANGPSISTMDDMLSMALEDNKEKEKFIKSYFHGDPKENISKKWEAIEKELGKEKTNQLKLDGKLGFLTFNNAPLIRHMKEETNLEADPSELALKGFYSEEKLNSLIDDLGKSFPLPELIQGENKEEKRANYIKWMSGQLQLSYPNEVLAHQIGSEGAISVNHPDKVRIALLKDNKDFRIGDYPINERIRELEGLGNEFSMEEKEELRSLHRAYSLAPDYESIQFLWENNLDAAFKITRLNQDQFTRLYTKRFEGGELKAMQIYQAAEYSSGLITNMAMAYGTQKVNPIPDLLASRDSEDADDTAETVKEYPTMEELFGSLDYASCDHCESLLSPSAYLVDLLQFIDLDKQEDLEGVNPITRLFEKRPDIEYLDLNCKNTHTVMPYIDLVNEVLEYYAVNENLKNYTGENTGEHVSSEELLANPQHVDKLRDAYKKLKGEMSSFPAVYPLNLPFNRSLTLLREFYNHFETPLYQAMEQLRTTEALESSSADYGWKDILMEQLGLSREEFKLFTMHGAHDIQTRYGLNSGDDLNKNLADDASIFSKKTDLEYEELVKLLRTKFINPAAVHIPKLEALQQAFNQAQEDNSTVSSNYGDLSLYEILQKIAQGNSNTIADIDKIFPKSAFSEADREDIFGGNLEQWIKDTYEDIKSLIFLKPTKKNVLSDFSKLKLAYADPDQSELKEIEYWKFIHFIRLWKKMGWSIEQTDTILSSLYDYSSYDFSGGDLGNLDTGFKDFLIRLALLNRVRKDLG